LANSPRIAEQFDKQAREARAIAERIGQRIG
jgi:hypothetical protein